MFEILQRLLYLHSLLWRLSFVRGYRGGQESGPPPPEKLQKYRVSLQYWPRAPDKHKAAKPAFNVRPSSFCSPVNWRADDEWYMDPLSPHQS